MVPNVPELLVPGEVPAVLDVVPIVEVLELRSVVPKVPELC